MWGCVMNGGLDQEMDCSIKQTLFSIKPPPFQYYFGFYLCCTVREQPRSTVQVSSWQSVYCILICTLRAHHRLLKEDIIDIELSNNTLEFYSVCLPKCNSKDCFSAACNDGYWNKPWMATENLSEVPEASRSAASFSSAIVNCLHENRRSRGKVPPEMMWWRAWESCSQPIRLVSVCLVSGGGHATGKQENTCTTRTSIHTWTYSENRMLYRIISTTERVMTHDPENITFIMHPGVCV